MFSQIAVSNANESIALPLGKNALSTFSSFFLFPRAFIISITTTVNIIATNAKCFGDEIIAKRMLLPITTVVSLKNKKYATITALTAEMITAPAATSLAIFAFGW